MSNMVYEKGFCIYQPNGSGQSKDILIFTHGGLTTKKQRYTNVPIWASLYFYTFMTNYGTDGQVNAFLSNPNPKMGVTSPNYVMTQQSVDTGIKDVSGKAIMALKNMPVNGGFGDKGTGTGTFMLTDGRVTSIAGPGSKVWDYELSYNESASRIINACEIASKSVPAWIGRDIFVLNGDKETRLSKVFGLLAGRGYSRIHYGACRVQSATGQAPWDSPTKVTA